jgi:hypothetical protein
MQRLDALLEILGPDWVAALGSDMTQTAFKFLAGWANPHQVKRLGRARLARWFQRETRKAWGERRADAVVSAAEATLALWGPTGLDYEAWPPTSPPKPASPSSSHARSPASMSGSSTTTATPTPTTSCCRSPVSARSSPVRSAADSGTPPVHQPGRGPVLLRAHPAPALLRAHRRRRRPDQTRRRLPARGAVPGRRPRPQDRPHPGRPLPAADVPDRPPPHLGAVHHRHRAVHPDRCLSAQRHPLPGTRCRRQPNHPRPGPSHRRRALSDPTRRSCRPPNDQQHPPRHRRGDERIEQGVAKRSTMTPVPPASLTPAASLDNH